MAPPAGALAISPAPTAERALFGRGRVYGVPLAGTLTIARWRVVGLVVATLWVGAVACGAAFDALLAMGAL